VIFIISLLHRLIDENDNAPQFDAPFYTATLNSQRTSFTTPIFIRAHDPDANNNGQITYLTSDPNVFVESSTGAVRLHRPFNPPQSGRDSPYLGSVLITARDLGNPSLSADTVLQLFSEEFLSRDIQFVFPFPPDQVNKSTVEEMLSRLTGGVVKIRDVVPWGNNRRSLPHLESSSRFVLNLSQILTIIVDWNEKILYLNEQIPNFRKLPQWSTFGT